MIDLGSWIPEIKELKNLPIEALGNLYFQGNVEKETTGKMPTITDQTITIFES